jgi:hypothetical protein
LFEPCIGFDAHCVPDPKAILLHHHDGTWHNQGNRINIYYHIKQYFIDIVLLFASILALMYLLKKK